MTSYTVKVTQEHIDAGQPCQCATCPVALAITAATPFEYVAVMSGEAWLSNVLERPASHYADLPGKAQGFISLFDSGTAKVKPFEFVLKVQES